MLGAFVRCSNMNRDLFREQLKNMSPIFIRRIVREGLKKWRETINSIDRLISKGLTEREILESLANGGIRTGDVLLVHSSLSRIGHVKGGASTVVAALLNAVGESGTVGAPTFWGNTETYLMGNRIFDARSSPTILGGIAEMIRCHPLAKRSLHPTHSAAFIGPRADFLTKDHHLDKTPVGRRSPYKRLAEIGGKILLLGVTVEYLTSFHTIEDVVPNFPVKVYLPEPLTFNVIDAMGIAIEVSTFCHCPMTGKTRETLKMEPYLRVKEVFREFSLGRASVKLIDAAKLHETLLALYDRGITMYKMPH
jgi:aminoglycoside 3-N-acetyltransferase